MKHILLFVLFVLGRALCAPDFAQNPPPAAISCTVLVSQSDCKTATAAFEVARDNKIFNQVEVLIADRSAFGDEKSRADWKRTRESVQDIKRSGLDGPSAVLSGEDQDQVLIFFERTPIPNVTRAVVSIDAFYKSDVDARGKISLKTHFDSSSTNILAAKINGFVNGWFMGVLSSIH